MTVTYLDRESVKLGGNGDVSELLAGLEVQRCLDEQRIFSSTYLGCSRAMTVTPLPPGIQFCTHWKTSFSIQAAWPSW